MSLGEDDRSSAYLGCFFAPLLLFFCLTGWCQAAMHNRQKGTGEPGDWKARLTSVHVDQIYPAESVSSYSPTGSMVVAGVRLRRADCFPLARTETLTRMANIIDIVVQFQQVHPGLNVFPVLLNLPTDSQKKFPF